MSSSTVQDLELKDRILDLSRTVIEKVNANFDLVQAKKRMGLSDGGDTQFGIDEIAEEAVYDYLKSNDPTLAYYSEDRGLVTFDPSPRAVLIIDPIDGTRGAAANLECCCFSIAAAPYREGVTIGDIEYAMLYEFKNDVMFYADHTGELTIRNSQCKLSPNTDPDQLFWSMEFNGHPSRIMTHCLGDLIDASANRGGVFIFNSASYSISRIITGQLDCYVDIGNRIVRDVPELDEDFRNVGNGKLLHLFPYDIAAAVYIAEHAGAVITDAYGNSLGSTKLLDISSGNLQSCIAASNIELHQKVMDRIQWIETQNDLKIKRNK